MKSNRFKTALEVQDACNPMAVANLLFKTMQAARADNVNYKEDAAVILIADKLWDLLGRPDGLCYSRAYEACEAKARVNTHADLIEAVRAIDRAAAAYLEGDAKRLPTFYPSVDLDGCFGWKSSPQGEQYWRDIEETLRKRGYYDEDPQ